MKCLNMNGSEASAEVCNSRDVHLPDGILGFEPIKHYVLISHRDEEPFRWLQVKDNPSLAFVVMEPFGVVGHYQPDIPEADVALLELREPADALLFNIVTLHQNQRATINLKGPIVINRATGVGKQVILANAAEYSVQHPLPAPEVAAV
jgi:flagellar assembly factor FliW